jgi:ribosomal protein S18 acetylase RimI-like enzyme
MVTVRELRPDDLTDAIAIIARGMRDNPLHISALGQPAGTRADRLKRMFTLALPMIFKKGVLLGAFDDDKLVGIAGLVPPGRCQPKLVERVRLLPRLIPAIGFRGFARTGRWLATWSKHDLAEPHWHLGPVAVDAPLQGHGIGTALMEEYCARLDNLAAVGYLETDKAQNVAFYEKFGFRTIAEALVLGTPNWFMRRPVLRSPSSE